MFDKMKKSIKLGFIGMFEGFTLKESLFCIITGLICTAALFIYLAYPLLFGIVEEKSDFMTVIEKNITTTPEYITIHSYSRSYVQVSRTSENKSFYIKTKREVQVYKLDKQNSKTFVKTKQEIKSYEVSEDVYNKYKVGTELEFDRANNTWNIKKL